jgi:hypothetical protein
MIFLLSEFQPGALQQGELREVLRRGLLHPPQHQGTLIKKKIKFSPYMRRPLVIYDFSTAPFWISLYMRKI